MCCGPQSTSVSYITGRSSKWTQLQEHLHDTMQIQYNNLLKTLRFYWNCVCEALSQHNGSFRGYKMVPLYYILIYCTYTVISYCVLQLEHYQISY